MKPSFTCLSTRRTRRLPTWSCQIRSLRAPRAGAVLPPDDIAILEAVDFAHAKQRFVVQLSFPSVTTATSSVERSKIAFAPQHSCHKGQRVIGKSRGDESRNAHADLATTITPAQSVTCFCVDVSLSILATSCRDEASAGKVRRSCHYRGVGATCEPSAGLLILLSFHRAPEPNGRRRHRRAFPLRSRSPRSALSPLRRAAMPPSCGP